MSTLVRPSSATTARCAGSCRRSSALTPTGTSVSTSAPFSPSRGCAARGAAGDGGMTGLAPLVGPERRKVAARGHRGLALGIARLPAEDALELVDQQGVLDGCGGHLPDAAQEVDVLGVVARSRVEHVDEADDALVGDQRDAELTLEPVLRHAGALLGGEAWVVQPGDGHDLSAAHGHGRRRELVHVEHLAYDRFVEAVEIGADHAAQALALERVDVAVGRLDRGAHTLRERAERLLEIAGLRSERAKVHDLTQDP